MFLRPSGSLPCERSRIQGLQIENVIDSRAARLEKRRRVHLLGSANDVDFQMTTSIDLYFSFRSPYS